MQEILFDRYEIIKEIGHGAFSHVYLVRDTHLNKLMALKKMNALPDNDVELDTLKSLSSEYFPVVYDYREDDEHSYLFMEYIDGVTLRDYLNKNGRTDVKRCVEWAKSIAQMIRFLHRQKPPVIFRDLKPENIMVRPDGTLKLIDFGGILRRSRSLDESRDNYATRGYSAPELFRTARPEMSADVFSIGALMHRMLTGIDPNRPPFLRSDIRQTDRSLPEGLSVIVGKCLSKDPADRYQCMDDLIKDLDNYKKLRRDKGIWFIVKRSLLWVLYASFMISILFPLVAGVRKEDMPFPYLYAPLMIVLLIILLRRIIYGAQDPSGTTRICKDIFLTEKKYMGLLGAVFFMLGALSAMIISGFGQNRAYAVGRSKSMWVSMCDGSERNILVKKGGTFKVKDKLRLEINREDIPEGEVRVRVTATGSDGTTYVSRDFDVEKSQ